jgi:hypothetical protein
MSRLSADSVGPARSMCTCLRCGRWCGSRYIARSKMAFRRQHPAAVTSMIYWYLPQKTPGGTQDFLPQHETSAFTNGTLTGGPAMSLYSGVVPPSAWHLPRTGTLMLQPKSAPALLALKPAHYSSIPFRTKEGGWMEMASVS